MGNAKNEYLRTYVPHKIDYLETHVRKKMLYVRVLHFPAPKMFFYPVFKDPSFEGLEPLLAY